MLRPPNLTSKAASNVNEFSGEPSVYGCTSMYVCAFVSVAGCLCNVRNDAWWRYQRSQPVQAFYICPYASFPLSLEAMPSVVPFGAAQRALRWPTISVKHERCSIQCSTMQHVASCGRAAGKT